MKAELNRQLAATATKGHYAMGSRKYEVNDMVSRSAYLSEYVVVMIAFAQRFLAMI